VRLSQAAFSATVFYAAAVTFDCLTGCAPEWGTTVPCLTIPALTFAAALVGNAIPSRPFAILAELLPEALYNTVGPSGVLSGECVAGRKPP